MNSNVFIVRRIQMQTALFLAFSMMLVLFFVLILEHYAGYTACNMCYQERIPYYIGLPIMLLTFGLAYGQYVSLLFIRIFLGVGAAIMLVSLFLALRHVGLENRWWEVFSCDIPPLKHSFDFYPLEQALDLTVFNTCENSVSYIFGLSLAGWNACMSFLLMVIALHGAFIKLN